MRFGNTYYKDWLYALGLWVGALGLGAVAIVTVPVWGPLWVLWRILRGVLRMDDWPSGGRGSSMG